MDNLKNKLIKEAKALKERKMFLYIIPISSPDYESSADKFKEVALMCKNKEEKIKYLKEAAETYLLNPVEYNRYNSYLIYQDIAELYNDGYEAYTYFIKSGEMAQSCNKESLAAKAFEKACDICIDLEKKIDLMSKIVSCYNSSSWKHHRINSLKQLAFLLFTNGEYEKAASNFLLIKSSIYTLCAGICYHLMGIDSDLDVSQEHKNIYDSLHKSPEELKKSIEIFLENNAIEKDVKKIFQMLIDKMNPENDIL